ncbi:hypothetical protein FNF27_01688 [Cafeteria roenbergensis]|uniref:FZ domain-containing protein n=1 Tax=Cafeteria roenbergensis TaxID=33653 RepID=A0A5A8EG77_CAFRO|nr:hypothetical protein FNF31_00720 [Cafeteria roenbergensis]KAA0171673.1 hypothetical protein FNF28_00606 [Cafeteria roenbergensis]KAA0176866.1 hypothetical protein FNF27_01688 [Cafeteria roenbergensis]
MVHYASAAVAVAAVVLQLAAVASGQALDVSCVPLDEFQANLTYCSEFVTWPVTPTAARELASREATAFAEYVNMREGYKAGNVSAPCLSYQAYYQCTLALPRCQLGRNQELCLFVCEEHARRCLGADYTGCAPSATVGSACSAAADAQASGFAVAAALLAAALLGAAGGGRM